MVARSISPSRLATCGTSATSSPSRRSSAPLDAAGVLTLTEERRDASACCASRFFRFSADFAIPPTTA
jgi:hypothetical protein